MTRIPRTFLTALLLAPLVVSAAKAPQQTWRITNDTLAVTVSARDAGAACSLVHDGQEFVNDHDHGRQLQVAWFYDDHGEAYDPANACGKMTAFFKHPAAPRRSYSYRTFIVVGDLATVQGGLRKLATPSTVSRSANRTP